MQPSLRAGDTLLGTGWFRPAIGQVVIVKRMNRLMVKRITDIQGDELWIEGDNKASSTDSRTFGSISRSQLRAKVIRTVE
jgi:type IV secretory pathway protease TraF